MIVDTSKMSSDGNEIFKLCGELEEIRSQVAGIKLGDSFSSNEWYITERQWLYKIAEDLEEQTQNMTALASALKDAVSLYEDAEQKIMKYPYRSIRRGALKGKEWTGNYGNGHAIIEEKTKWYQTNEGKLLVSLGTIAIAAAGCYFTGGLATPAASALMKTTILGAGGTAVLNGGMEVASGGKFEDGFADGALWGGIAGATLGGTDAILGTMAFGSAKSAIATYGALNGWGTGGLYLAEQTYDDKKPTLTGFLGSVGFGTATSMLTVGMLHNYNLVSNTQTGEISQYASSLKQMNGDDWNKYFSGKYGANNVEWVSGKPNGEAWRNYYIEQYGYDNVKMNGIDSIESDLKAISESDRLRINSWRFTPSDELYLKYKSVYDNPLYYDQATGSIHWPPDDGFKVGTRMDDKIISEGMIFKRYGANSGEFLGNATDTFEARALAPHSEGTEVHYYQLTEDYKMSYGKAASWFGSEGGAEQFVKYKPDGTKYSVKELEVLGVIEDVTDIVNKGVIKVE